MLGADLGGAIMAPMFAWFLLVKVFFPVWEAPAGAKQAVQWITVSVLVLAALRVIAVYVQGLTISRAERRVRFPFRFLLQKSVAFDDITHYRVKTETSYRAGSTAGSTTRIRKYLVLLEGSFGAARLVFSNEEKRDGFAEELEAATGAQRRGRRKRKKKGGKSKRRGA